MSANNDLTPDQAIALRTKVRAVVSAVLSSPEDEARLSDGDDLLDLLDSLEVLRVITDLEGIYEVKVVPSEMTPENLGSIEKLSAFLSTKRRA